MTNQTTDRRGSLPSSEPLHTSEDQGYPFPVLVLTLGFRKRLQRRDR